MDEKLFEELESNLKEATKIARGRKPETAYVVLTAADIKAIRAKQGMSQSEFARAFQLSLETIKGWEQGKRSPDAAATNLLRLIDADAETVQRLLAA